MKKEDEKLLVNFLIRMTETEKKILVQRAKNLKISQAEYLRKSIIAFEDKNERDQKNSSVLSKQEYNLLLNIANNLNQNTKFANINKVLHEQLDEAINNVMLFIELKS
jgi:hypothetical protein